jgi:3-dehydroquinate dehydratase-1
MIGMKKMLCVSLTENTFSKCSTFIQTCEADMIEHRMDFMNRIENLGSLYSSSEKPIIATCRSINSGGYFKGSEAQRIGYLLEALSAGASYVDVELDTNPTQLDAIVEMTRNTNSKLIVSKHFPKITPSLKELMNALIMIRDTTADVAKIVTTPSTIEDCQVVLQLYGIRHRPKFPLISFAMEDLGKFTRVCALFFGAPFMYVAQDNGVAAAPGQIELSKMRTILEVLQ